MFSNFFSSRWIVKRLQMEFNELLSRTAAGKLLHDIKLRNFSVGTQFPVIKDIQVSRVTLAPDKDSFQVSTMSFILSLEGLASVNCPSLRLVNRWKPICSPVCTYTPGFICPS